MSRTLMIYISIFPDKIGIVRENKVLRYILKAESFVGSDFRDCYFSQFWPGKKIK